MKISSKYCKFGEYQIQLLPLLICTFTVIILISLGIWQIGRLKEKTLFLNTIKSNMSAPPLELEAINIDMTHSLEKYRRVKISGHFLPNKDLHLYGRQSMSTEKDGYYLITPFQTNNNKIIMIARGWFSSRYKKIINNRDDYSTEITGIILPTEKPRTFILDNDINNNVWFTLNLQQASEILGLKLEDFYIFMEHANAMSNNMLVPLSIDRLMQVRNDHLEYAITWFSLAVSLIVIFIIYHRRKKI